MNIPEDEKHVTKKELEATKLELLAKLENNATKDDIKNFATKDDIKNFATKDDIKNFATKDDIKNFATKDDIKNFATKDDIKNLATKDEIKKLATKVELKKLDLKFEILATEFIAMNKRLEKVENNTNLILQTLDGIVKRLDISETERAATEHAFRRHENMLDDHETRITALEAK